MQIRQAVQLGDLADLGHLDIACRRCDRRDALGYRSRVGKPFAPNQANRMLDAPDPPAEVLAA